MMIVRQDDTVVDALIRRLQRDGILQQALRIRNYQHQVSPHASHTLMLISSRSISELECSAFLHPLRALGL